MCIAYRGNGTLDAVRGWVQTRHWDAVAAKTTRCVGHAKCQPQSASPTTAAADCAAFWFTNFNNYRIRTLLDAGKPNCALLNPLTPTENAKRRLFTHPRRNSAACARGYPRRGWFLANSRNSARKSQSRVCHPPADYAA